MNIFNIENCDTAKRTGTLKLNHCSGVDVPICYSTIQGEITEEEHEKIVKRKMLKSMTLILDHIAQQLLQGM